MGFMMKKSERKKAQAGTGKLQGGECPDSTSKDAVVDKAEGEGMQLIRIRLCVDINGQQHRKLKVYAAQQGITLNELIERLADSVCDS